jgi:hypothetical protein
MVKRPRPSVVECEFRSTTNPDLVLSFPCRKLSRIQWLAVLDIANDRTARYVTGYGKPDEPGYEPPQNLPPVDELPVYLSSTSCQIATAFEYAQVKYEEEERYTFEELAAFMQDDAIFTQMSVKMAELQPEDGEAKDPLDKKPGQE